MNRFHQLFDEQKALFASNVTRSRAWRVDQLDRTGRMIKENEAALQNAIARDFKTASQEYVFEAAATFHETEYQESQLETWMAPSKAPVPKALARTGHKRMRTGGYSAFDRTAARAAVDFLTASAQIPVRPGQLAGILVDELRRSRILLPSPLNSRSGNPGRKATRSEWPMRCSRRASIEAPPGDLTKAQSKSGLPMFGNRFPD